MRAVVFQEGYMPCQRSRLQLALGGIVCLGLSNNAQHFLEGLPWLLFLLRGLEEIQSSTSAESDLNKCFTNINARLSSLMNWSLSRDEGTQRGKMTCPRSWIHGRAGSRNQYAWLPGLCFNSKCHPCNLLQSKVSGSNGSLCSAVSFVLFVSVPSGSWVPRLSCGFSHWAEHSLTFLCGILLVTLISL